MLVVRRRFDLDRLAFALLEVERWEWCEGGDMFPTIIFIVCTVVMDIELDV